MVFYYLKQKREIRRLRSLLKHLDHKVLPLFRSVPFEDQIHSLQYLIESKIKERVVNLEYALQMKRRENGKKVQQNHLDYLEHKLSKIASRITLFRVEHSEEEFKKICSVLDFIERDLGHV